MLGYQFEVASLVSISTGCHTRYGADTAGPPSTSGCYDFLLCRHGVPVWMSDETASWARGRVSGSREKLEVVGRLRALD